jgi:hypothetical protein
MSNEYKTKNPNILCTKDTNNSQFKGLMWAARTTEIGYRWHVGNEKNVRF